MNRMFRPTLFLTAACLALPAMAQTPPNPAWPQNRPPAQAAPPAPSVDPQADPAEASWEGHLTLEFSNSSGADCRIYAEEGICQLLFFEGDPCETTYQDRAGKYQYQPERVTLAKI